MRFSKRGLLIVICCLLTVTGGLIVNDRIEAAQRDRFYASRPMLRAMDDALPAPGKSGKDVTAILLAHVPAGSVRADALRALGAEGIACAPVNGVDGPFRMVCSATDRPAFVVPRWHVEVHFDQNDGLAGARVLALKATE